jgi:hypothetical protein
MGPFLDNENHMNKQCHDSELMLKNVFVRYVTEFRVYIKVHLN